VNYQSKISTIEEKRIPHPPRPIYLNTRVKNETANNTLRHCKISKKEEKRIPHPPRPIYLNTRVKTKQQTTLCARLSFITQLSEYGDHNNRSL